MSKSRVPAISRRKKSLRYRESPLTLLCVIQRTWHTYYDKYICLTTFDKYFCIQKLLQVRRHRDKFKLFFRRKRSVWYRGSPPTLWCEGLKESQESAQRLRLFSDGKFHENSVGFWTSIMFVCHYILVRTVLFMYNEDIQGTVSGSVDRSEFLFPWKLRVHFRLSLFRSSFINLTTFIVGGIGGT